jgi:WD40 repeat protein
LSGADLTCTLAEGAEFHQVLARDILVQEANLTAAIWRRSDALNLRGGHTALWYDCQWLDCAVDPITLPEDFGRQGVRTGQYVTPIVADVQQTEATTVFGHADSVWACSYAPDGTQPVSGSNDGTVKLWDVHSGQCLRTLSGHTGAVRACSYAPDGTLVVSAAEDGTMRLWDMRTGAELLTMIHGPDGQTATIDHRHNRILAASSEAGAFQAGATSIQIPSACASCPPNTLAPAAEVSSRPRH